MKQCARDTTGTDKVIHWETKLRKFSPDPDIIRNKPFTQVIRSPPSLSWSAPTVYPDQLPSLPWSPKPILISSRAYYDHPQAYPDPEVYLYLPEAIRIPRNLSTSRTVYPDTFDPVATVILKVSE